MLLRKIGLGSQSEPGRSVSAERPEWKEEEMILFSLGRHCLGGGAVLKLDSIFVSDFRMVMREERNQRRGKERLSETSKGDLPVYQ